jgi:hypothetical protein
MEDQKQKPIQPFYLPQVSAPYSFVRDTLLEFDIHVRPVIVSVGQLKPLQKEVDFEKIKAMSKQKDLKTAKPVYISVKDHILDGHHRVSSVKYIEGDKAKIHAIRLLCDEKDGVAALKLIQDRWEQKHGKNK